jgi:tRNA(Ile)-lysidine synthase
VAQPRRVDRPLGGPGYPLVDRTLHVIERHRMLAWGDTVVVGASGGPDSTCLLDVLVRLSEKLELSLVVAHVDHGLSEGSDRVASDVARRGAEAGYDVHVVRAPDLAGSNLQARARDFRYEFFDIVAQRVGADRIATGHTLDDRVETTLARLVHGAGTEGLAGLPPAEGTRIRPLIETRRKETRLYCEECSLAFFEDPANLDERFERVRVRKKLVAAIEDMWGEGAVRAVANSAERLREDAQALAELADRLYPDVVTDADGEQRIAVDALKSMPRALRRRLLESAVGRVRDRSGGIEAVLDALDRQDRTPRDAKFSAASGTEIAISGGDVVVRHRMS